jgi:hypothetical protein
MATSSPDLLGASSPASLNAGTLDDRLTASLNSQQFTVAAYLNLALASQRENAKDDPTDVIAQQRMAELALQLQLQTQSCHEEIGRIGAELQAILPRCAADIGRVGVGLEGLRQDATSLLETTSVDMEQDVSSSLETLSTLHALQANLTRTKEILTAAATWDSTLSTIAPLLAQQNLPDAVNALAQLENGAQALQGMPGLEDRDIAVANVRQQVSILLQPQLQNALIHMQTRLGPLQQCVLLYSKLDKIDALKEDYVKTRPTSLHKSWFDYSPSYGDDVADQNATAFLAWLPTWFDAVLTLIGEERRQALAVFGPESVSEIVMKVFRECFRPILPSFKSRLESIYSSEETGPSKGSLQSVCSIYESTLQFLSLAYETIAGGWLDLVEGGTIKGNGLSIFKEMGFVFRQIASPFVSYQQRLPNLETRYSTATTQTIIREMHQAVSDVSNGKATLETLQTATQLLQELSGASFPLAEGAVARFELLNGGYNSASALQAVDKIVATYCGELAIAIRTLSATTTADETALAVNFDESHVLCALEVLKIAGAFRKNLLDLEVKTRERLTVLSSRMSSYISKEKELEEVPATTTRKSSAAVVLLPDSFSAVEIDSFLTKAVCFDEENNETNAALVILQRLAESGPTSVPLYPETEDATRRLATSCHTFVFDVCAAVPRLHLKGMSSLQSWKEANEQDINSYGILPQSYITHVGEHMLALVQALEPFASDSEALGLANEVMGGVHGVAMQPWREFLSASGTMGSEDVIKSLMNGENLDNFVVASAALGEEEGTEEEESEANKFCNVWLDVVSTAVTGRLLERIMRIPSLTPKGCEHLNTDLNYLVNVFSALGVRGHPHPLLGHLAELALVEADVLAHRIDGRNRGSSIEASLRSVEERLSAMKSRY